MGVSLRIEHLPEDEQRWQETSVGAQALQRARSNAAARMSACFEDLISFLEMHRISGAYALAFAANGVEDLSTLLLLDDEKLNEMIIACDMDAMDEILLRDALGHSRGLK